jgi:hypothetical protein
MEKQEDELDNNSGDEGDDDGWSELGMDKFSRIDS